MTLKVIYTDHELLLKIKQGNEDAFELLYFRYFEALCKYAYKKIQHEDIVEELVQDVFVDLWNKRSNLDSTKQIAALLFAMLRNKALHELRAKMIQDRHMEQFLLLQDGIMPSIDDKLYAKQISEQMQMAINRLSPQCREAFTLSRYEHLAYKDIAARMGISVNTVEKHIGKALMLLRQEFKQYDLPILLIIGLLELIKL